MEWNQPGPKMWNGRKFTLILERGKSKKKEKEESTEKGSTRAGVTNFIAIRPSQ